MHHKLYSFGSTASSKAILLLLGLVLAAVVTSCKDGNEQPVFPQQYPIGFTSVTADQEAMTRATTPLARDFRVYGYKETDGASVQTVFQGYRVTYLAGSANTSEDNTHGYSYVDAANNQSIKYWDLNAQGYNFWGATKALVSDGGIGSFNDNGTVLTITGLTQSVTEPALDGQLFSALYHRSPVTNDVVQLEFKRPYAKVRVLFYTNTGLTDNDFDNIKISNISFGPESPAQIITAGDLKVTYPQTGDGQEAFSTQASTEAASLTFDDVVLDHTHGTASNNSVTAVPTDGTEYYFVVPNNNATPFTLSAHIDTEDKTAVVPAELMDWRPNFVYTYIFKILGGKYIELYDVQIDPWMYGGAQEEEWRNW